jgi:hypothetical protein
MQKKKLEEKNCDWIIEMMCLINLLVLTLSLMRFQFFTKMKKLMMKNLLSRKNLKSQMK